MAEVINVGVAFSSNTLIGGHYLKSSTITVGTIIRSTIQVGPAQPGSLTTRTNNTDGTLTMTNSGHGITTASRIDLYWTVAGVKGTRRGVTVGTVSGTSVPITGGAGDNLPVASTPITAMIPTSQALSAVGNNILLYLGYSNRRGLIVFTDGANAELGWLQFDADTGGTDGWWGLGTSQFVGDTIAKVFYSTADAVNKANLEAIVGY